MKYVFRVYGEPMQYRAPGFRKLPDGRVITHSDKRVVEWQREIQKQLRAYRTSPLGNYPGAALMGAIHLDLWVFVTRPKTVTSIYPDTRPDSSNFLKTAEDALNKLAIEDDGQIVTTRLYERWAYMNYPECGRPRKPGLIYIIKTIEVDPEQKFRMNQEYKEYLAAHNLEYRTIEVGRKKKRKTVLVEV